MSGKRRSRVLAVFGTRPEAIKMAPVILELRQHAQIETITCVTGQHRNMLDEALDTFGIRADHDLNIMQPGQTLTEITTRVLTKLTPFLTELKPDRVLVHGDTTTTFAAAVASFYLGIHVGHVEAGLRTGNLQAPWPEEFNRRATDIVADQLWAPTENAADALRREGVAEENIYVTGNTVIDAMRLTCARIEVDADIQRRLHLMIPELDQSKRLVLVTGHRRESFGGGLAQLCQALNELASRPDIVMVWPVHPNPNVIATVEQELRKRPNVHVIEPIEYLSFIALMMRAHLIISDSGGIQEEASALGKPVLVTRVITERPEAVAAGTARLVGYDTRTIVATASELLDCSEVYERMSAGKSPFGDGFAARRIVDTILDRYDGRR